MEGLRSSHLSARHPTGAAPPSTYEQLLRSEWPRLVRLADAIIGDRAAAEDLVQDSCLRFLNTSHPVDNPAAFLRTIVINRCKTHTVKRSRERSLPIAAPTPASQPEIDETFTALAKLSPRHRTVLALRFYEDLSVDAIAELTGIRAGTVKSLLNRGLNQLRTELERTPR